MFVAEMGFVAVVVAAAAEVRHPESAIMKGKKHARSEVRAYTHLREKELSGLESQLASNLDFLQLRHSLRRTDDGDTVGEFDC